MEELDKELGLEEEEDEKDEEKEEGEEEKEESNIRGRNSLLFVTTY